VAWSTNAQAAGGVGTAIPAGSVATTFVISKPGAYYLAGERVMTDNTKPIIAIACDDVTLDLSGYSISFADASAGNSPAIISSKTNIEIRNGSVANVPNTGINLYSTTQSRVVGVRVSDVVIGSGISVGSAALVNDCELFNCDSGISVGSGSAVENCRVTKTNGTGIYANTSCIIRSNVVRSTKGSGILCNYSSLIEGNCVTDANLSNSDMGAGIWLTNGATTVRGNQISYCGARSICVNGKALIDGNTIYSNDAAHIALVCYNYTASAYRNNNLNAKTATSGPWINGGGNVIF
jgi:hypothetical protein